MLGVFLAATLGCWIDEPSECQIMSSKRVFKTEEECRLFIAEANGRIIDSLSDVDGRLRAPDGREFFFAEEQCFKFEYPIGEAT